MVGFVVFPYVLKIPTVQFENPAAQTWRGLRRIFEPEQYFRENVLENVLVGAWWDPWRLMTRNVDKSWNFAFDIRFFNSNFGVNISPRECLKCIWLVDTA